jgi:hypothetical protein
MAFADVRVVFEDIRVVFDNVRVVFERWELKEIVTGFRIANSHEIDLRCDGNKGKSFRVTNSNGVVLWPYVI